MTLYEFVERSCTPGVSKPYPFALACANVCALNPDEVLTYLRRFQHISADGKEAYLRLAPPAEIIRRFQTIFRDEPWRTINDVVRWSGRPELRSEFERLFP